MASYPVQVYIYDISKGLARSMSRTLLGKHLEGVWHTAVVVYGQEFFFGSMGIESCAPCHTVLGSPDKIEEMGNTEIPVEMFMDYMAELAGSTYQGQCYHLLDHNCNTFTNEVSEFLTGKPIPSYVTNLPQEVLDTPLGAMLRPFVDAMSVAPSGGTPIQQSLGYNPALSRGSPTGGATCPPPPAEDNSRGKHPVSPVTFNEKSEVLAELQDVWEDLMEAVGSDKTQMLIEIRDYLSATDPDWGLGRGHIRLLESILMQSDSSDVQKRAAAGLLQELLRLTDINSMLVQDQTSTYIRVLQGFEQLDVSVQERLVKGMTNSCSCTPGRKLHMDSRPDSAQLTCTVCRLSLLDDNSKLYSPGAALASNLTASDKVTESVAFELGCALVELLNKELDTDTAKCAVTALSNCMDCNEEVAALAVVSGVNVSDIHKRFPVLDNLIIHRLKDSLHQYST